MEAFSFIEVLSQTGLLNVHFKQMVMWIVGLSLIYLAIKKEYEPLVLLPIGFAIFIVNLPVTDLMKKGHLLEIFYHYGIEWEVIPPIIFLGLGAMTDFGPLIANPKTLILGAGAQFGVYVTFFSSLLCFRAPRRSWKIEVEALQSPRWHLISSSVGCSKHITSMVSCD